MTIHQHVLVILYTRATWFHQVILRRTESHSGLHYYLFHKNRIRAVLLDLSACRAIQNVYYTLLIVGMKTQAHHRKWKVEGGRGQTGQRPVIHILIEATPPDGAVFLCANGTNY